MKRFFLAAVFLLSVLSLADAQPRARDFREATDSLKQRMKRRTGVETTLKLEKVTVRGKALDFYFSQELADYPWRQEDPAWFRSQLKELGAQAIGSYSVGTLYAKKQKLNDLPMPLLTRDGTPANTSLKVEDPRSKTIPLVQGDDSWPMGLQNRHIALWQSHGRYWEAKTDRWEWQRAATHRTVEDLYTQSYVLPFLIPMLENAGAVVVTPRERDPQPYEVVCDNDPSFETYRRGFLRRKGTYEEKGEWQDAGTGFADQRETYQMYENPFKMGTARKTATSSGEDAHRHAEAVWRADIPEKGYYAVYVSYKTLPGSTTDARYTVSHLGGETLLHVNQTMGGGTWVYLGTFLFDKGGSGYVKLTNRSSSSGIVTADAVRFGGGMGKMERGGTLSGMPAYVEGALYEMQWNGIEMNLFDDWDNDYTKDFAGRGKWVQELSGGSRVNPGAEGRNIPFDLSLAFHSDAGITPNDSIVGTLAIYTLKADNSDLYPTGESRMNGRLLSDQVQTQVVEDIRAQFDPLWNRRQTWDRSYSESRTTGVPGMLLELLSHQNFADMRYGLDPTFRFTACRAVYKGILKYLSARYGCRYVVQPLPVHAFRADLEDGKAVLSWEPTPDPLEPTASAGYYRVYTRKDDGGFDSGKQVSEPSCTLHLEPGHVYSFKVEACNEGGKSFPSEILSAGYPGRDARKVLVVNNFTRVSAPTWFDTPTYAGFLDNVDSGVPWGTDILYAGAVNQFDRTAEWTDDDNPGFGGSYTDQGGSRIAGNTFDFVSVHGKALLEAGYAFASSSTEAFDGQADAFAIDLICGKQVTTRVGNGAVPDRYTVFPENLQTAIRTFTGKGGHVILSGSYIGTDAWNHVFPVETAPESTRTFIQEVLGYKWVTNFGDTSGEVEPARSAPCKLPTASYNRAWSSSIYRVESPDGLEPASENTWPVLRYKNTKITAGTAFQGKGYRAVAFGFPLETSPQLRELLSATLQYLER
ncbi:MAG: xanthan lyase [Bacteroidales bacterium]|nr:xanthan lyase [Bacteroidales bacterium]